MLDLSDPTIYQPGRHGESKYIRDMRLRLLRQALSNLRNSRNNMNIAVEYVCPGWVNSLRHELDEMITLTESELSDREDDWAEDFD